MNQPSQHILGTPICSALTTRQVHLRQGGSMAGERMQVDGYVEISAVCVHNDYRGKGLAGRLVNVLRRNIEARGDTAFLHVRNDNHAAIGLYERLGFKLRRPFHLISIERVPAPVC
ncbi:GNAT family N-acetyltransferase [Paraburkholderia sp. BR14320]|uniref:GNAT family N-acetyltransferase n=1 Tax=unclassified Paraburkholderia TaxID=2615204 RepID=UPI0034D00750